MKFKLANTKINYSLRQRLKEMQINELLWLSNNISIYINYAVFTSFLAIIFNEYLHSRRDSFILIKRRKINRAKGIKQYATYVREIADKKKFYFSKI